MFYVVSTPIGNLADITYRAVDTLRSVDLVLCEDTRHTLVLLNKYDIKKPLRKYERFSEKRQLDDIVEMLKAGKDIALVSDAGTPIISDPGSPLICRLKSEGLDYTAIGGQCAAINALVLSGFDASSFCFAGFLPEKNIDRQKFISAFKDTVSTLMFYISPHNVDADLTFLASALGSRPACLVREISKIYEEHIDFVLPELPPEVTRKGEMVLIVAGASKLSPLLSLSVAEHFAHYIAEGMGEKAAMKQTASDRGVPKSEVYAAVKIK